LFPPADDDEDLVFFLSEVLLNSLTTISILIVSMAPTSDKFDPQVSNDEALLFPGPTIKQTVKNILLTVLDIVKEQLRNIFCSATIKEAIYSYAPQILNKRTIM
jgi:hypothetical protein